MIKKISGVFILICTCILLMSCGQQDLPEDDVDTGIIPIETSTESITTTETSTTTTSSIDTTSQGTTTSTYTNVELTYTTKPTVYQTIYLTEKEVSTQKVTLTSTVASSTTTTTTLTTTQLDAAAPQMGKTFVKTFSKGTLYAYGVVGGSGRTLINCATGNNIVRGSIASSYLYKNFGYNYNDKRTMVYLEVSGFPQMNGYYFLDDCDAGNPNVIDFYYTSIYSCPFWQQGVTPVDCYIVNY